MAGAGMPSYLSGLRGVTVRNTFLEFQDDDFFVDPSDRFGRQASEPAKPHSSWNRQMSDQTTAGSGATFEECRGRDLMVDESITDTEDSLAQIASYMGMGPPLRGGMPFPTFEQLHMPSHMDVAGNALQAALQAVALQAKLPPLPLPTPCPVPVEHIALQSAPVARFCPNCGAKVDRHHRFCPYCCYQLQLCNAVLQNAAAAAAGGPSAFPGADATAGLSFPPGQHRLPMASSSSSQGSAVQSPVCYLQRFRYVEANPADVQLARALCLAYFHGNS